MKQNFVITIGRQYGSGGRTVGERLAKTLGIHFYDSNILEIVSERTAIGEQFFRLADEKAGNNLLYKIVQNLTPDIGKPSTEGNIINPDNLFRFQAEIIREIAKAESCIIAGRCGNYILKEAGFAHHLDFFVYGDLVTRVKRTMEYLKVSEEEALKQIKKIDRERSEYHRYYTGEDWMRPDNYDLMINATRIDYEEMERLMMDYIRMKGYID